MDMKRQGGVKERGKVIQESSKIWPTKEADADTDVPPPAHPPKLKTCPV